MYPGSAVPSGDVGVQRHPPRLHGSAAGRCAKGRQSRATWSCKQADLAAAVTLTVISGFITVTVLPDTAGRSDRGALDMMNVSSRLAVGLSPYACVCVCVCYLWPDGTSWINIV